MLNIFSLDFLKIVSINYSENQKSAEIIRIRIEDLSFNASDSKVQFNSLIELVYPDHEVNGIKFTSRFSIKDPETAEKFAKKDGKDRSEAISLLFTYIYPFIRENVWTILKDTANPILLPMIDCRWIDLNKGLELRRYE